MSKKYFSLALVTLTISSLIMAADYNAPNIKFKETSPSYKATKAAEFNDGYKVESLDKTDRAIASEKDREPSSYQPKDIKKKAEPTFDEDEKSVKDEPKPWLYNTIKGKENR